MGGDVARCRHLGSSVCTCMEMEAVPPRGPTPCLPVVLQVGCEGQPRFSKHTNSLSVRIPGMNGAWKCSQGDVFLSLDGGVPAPGPVCTPRPDTRAEVPGERALPPLQVAQQLGMSCGVHTP